MDTTPEYIKMCEKAREIQALRDVKDSAEERDWFVCPKCESLFKEDDGYFYVHCEHFGEFATWLPRQDQLQEMVKEIINKIHFVFRFYEFLSKRYDSRSHQNAFIVFINKPNGTSMEQFWLAFVMQEKYSKQWVNGEWINIK